MFRAAMSIPSNIAEGRAKNSDKDFSRFLGYALSSSSELEHHLIVARDTKVIPEGDFVSAISQTITVRKMLYGLLNCLSKTERDSSAKRSTIQEGPQPEAGRPTAIGR